MPGRLRVEGPVGTETLAKIDQHVAPELPDQPGAAAAVFDLTGRVNEHVTGQNVRPVLTSGCADRVYLTGRHVQIPRVNSSPGEGELYPPNTVQGESSLRHPRILDRPSGKYSAKDHVIPVNVRAEALKLAMPLLCSSSEERRPQDHPERLRGETRCSSSCSAHSCVPQTVGDSRFAEFELAPILAARYSCFGRCSLR